MDTKLRTALLLLTCDREEETQKTIDSLIKHVDLERFVLLHGDDASATNENCLMAWKAGFKTVVRPPRRRGVCHMWSSLIARAARLDIDWIVTQENDWAWVKDFPFDIFEAIQADPGIYYMRFFGKFKEEGNKRTCGVMHSGKKIHPDWKEYKPGWEIGDIHWGFPGNATRIQEAVYLTEGIKAENHCRKRSGAIDKLTIRPIDNYLNHIGFTRTPGFKV